MSEIIISAKIWELKDGQITKILIDNTVYKIEKIENLPLVVPDYLPDIEDFIEAAEEADFQEHQNEYKHKQEYNKQYKIRKKQLTIEREKTKTKKCTHCHIIKPLWEFYHRGDNKNRYQSWCKKCVNSARRKPKVIKAEQQQKGDIAVSDNRFPLKNKPSLYERLFR